MGKSEDPGLAAEPFLLGEDEYFVLGDNRNDSIDSREPEVGAVRREDILGRAVFRVWPLHGVWLSVQEVEDNEWKKR